MAPREEPSCLLQLPVGPRGAFLSPPASVGSQRGAFLSPPASGGSQWLPEAPREEPSCLLQLPVGPERSLLVSFSFQWAQVSLDWQMCRFNPCHLHRSFTQPSLLFSSVFLCVFSFSLLLLWEQFVGVWGNGRGFFHYSGLHMKNTLQAAYSLSV